MSSAATQWLDTNGTATSMALITLLGLIRSPNERPSGDRHLLPVCLIVGAQDSLRLLRWTNCYCRAWWYDVTSPLQQQSQGGQWSVLARVAQCGISQMSTNVSCKIRLLQQLANFELAPNGRYVGMCTVHKWHFHDWAISVGTCRAVISLIMTVPNTMSCRNLIWTMTSCENC